MEFVVVEPLARVGDVSNETVPNALLTIWGRAMIDPSIGNSRSDIRNAPPVIYWVCWRSRRQTLLTGVRLRLQLRAETCWLPYGDMIVLFLLNPWKLLHLEWSLIAYDLMFPNQIFTISW